MDKTRKRVGHNYLLTARLIEPNRLFSKNRLTDRQTSNYFLLKTSIKTRLKHLQLSIQGFVFKIVRLSNFQYFTWLKSFPGKFFYSLTLLRFVCTINLLWKAYLLVMFKLFFLNRQTSLQTGIDDHIERLFACFIIKSNRKYQLVYSFIIFFLFVTRRKLELSAKIQLKI